jgi:hypothetical protein
MSIDIKAIFGTTTSLATERPVAHPADTNELADEADATLREATDGVEDPYRGKGLESVGVDPHDDAALDDLAKAGLGTWQPVPTTDKGGRPGRVFRLGNSGNGYTTHLNREENGRSVAVASVGSPETQDAGPDVEAVNRLLIEAAEEDSDVGRVRVTI